MKTEKKEKKRMPEPRSYAVELLYGKTPPHASNAPEAVPKHPRFINHRPIIYDEKAEVVPAIACPFPLYMPPQGLLGPLAPVGEA